MSLFSSLSDSSSSDSSSIAGSLGRRKLDLDWKKDKLPALKNNFDSINIFNYALQSCLYVKQYTLQFFELVYCWATLEHNFPVMYGLFI